MSADDDRMEWDRHRQSYYDYRAERKRRREQAHAARIAQAKRVAAEKKANDERLEDEFAAALEVLGRFDILDDPHGFALVHSEWLEKVEKLERKREARNLRNASRSNDD